MGEELTLRSEEELAAFARDMARVRPRHVGVLLLDSASRLVSYLLFPVRPDPVILLAALFAARAARVVVVIVREGVPLIESPDQAFAVELLEGARFLRLSIDALLVTPSGHAVVMRSEMPPISVEGLG